MNELKPQISQFDQIIDNWPNESLNVHDFSTSRLKKLFRFAKFIEKACEHVDHLASYRLATDRLLSKFFEHENIDLFVVDLAVRIYRSIHDDQPGRFQSFLFDFLATSICSKILIDYFAN